MARKKINRSIIDWLILVQQPVPTDNTYDTKQQESNRNTRKGG